MNNAAALCNNYFDSYEKTYNESALNEKEGCYQNGWNQKIVHLETMHHLSIAFEKLMA